MTRRISALTASLLWFLAPGSLQAQQPLDAVHDLYASANYEAALSALDRLETPAAPDAAVQMDQVRVLCLVALGRQGEADVIIERIITTDPAFEPGDEIPPRIRAAFGGVQRRVLPRIARDLYVAGKGAYDRQAYDDAVRTLQRTLAILDRLPEEDRSELTDLRMLGEGFIELSRAALTRLEPPPAPEPAASAPPVEEVSPPPPPTEAVPIRQDMPPWDPAVVGGHIPMRFTGVIEVDIDETGAVTAARIIDPSYGTYDVLLLEAARSWRYKPAQRNGQPVKSTRRVGVVLEPR